MKSFFLPAVILILAGAASGCYYDKESELYPQGSCDTAAVKWSTTIHPIIATNCAYSGCHEGANAPQGIVLTDYDGAKAIAQDGSLVGSIAHETGYQPMPRGTTKLPDCQISQIRIWVAGGAQNN